MVDVPPWTSWSKLRGSKNQPHHQFLSSLWGEEENGGARCIETLETAKNARAIEEKLVKYKVPYKITLFDRELTNLRERKATVTKSTKFHSVSGENATFLAALAVIFRLVYRKMNLAGPCCIEMLHPR